MLLSELEGQGLPAQVITQLLSIGLLLQSFSSMNFSYSEIILLNKEILNRLWVVLEGVALEPLLQLAWKEVGKDARLTKRVGDMAFIHRMGWLLSLTERALRQALPASG